MSGLRYWNAEFWTHVVLALAVILGLPMLFFMALILLAAYLLS